MRTSTLSILVAVLCSSSVAQGAIASFHRQSAICNASSYWPGWSGIKHTFIFGDSYTQTGFLVNSTQPTPTNPLGNPAYPGYTASNGPNWVDFLTVKYNSSAVLTYNIAYGGATMDASLVAPYEPAVSSIVDQIDKEWFPAYGGEHSNAPWTSSDTLFAIFDGINDVGNSWWLDTATLNAKIFAIYRGLVDSLYDTGARNFAFLTVPPVDRSPLALGNDAGSQASEKSDIAFWNTALLNMTRVLKMEKSDVNIFVVDANKYFTQVLDNPASYPQTALYKNTTAYCSAYSR